MKSSERKKIPKLVLRVSFKSPMSFRRRLHCSNIFWKFFIRNPLWSLTNLRRREKKKETERSLRLSILRATENFLRSYLKDYQISWITRDNIRLWIHRESAVFAKLESFKLRLQVIPFGLWNKVIKPKFSRHGDAKEPLSYHRCRRTALKAVIRFLMLSSIKKKTINVGSYCNNYHSCNRNIFFFF